MSRRIICASLAFGAISAVGFLYNYITKQKKLLKDGDLTNSIIQIDQPTKPTDVEIVMPSESTIVEEITRPVSPSPTFVDDGVTNTDAEYIKRSESENTPAIPFHQDLLNSSIQIDQPTKPTDVEIVMTSESTIVEEITRPVSPSPLFVDDRGMVESYNTKSGRRIKIIDKNSNNIIRKQSLNFVEDKKLSWNKAEFKKRSGSENNLEIPFYEDLPNSRIQIEQPTKATKMKIVMPIELLSIAKEITRPVSPSFVDIPDEMMSITSKSSKRPRMSIPKNVIYFADKRKSYPVLLVEEIFPDFNFIETLHENSPPVFKVKCVIDGYTFCAYNRSKRAANRMVAKFILNYFFDEEDHFY